MTKGIQNGPVAAVDLGSNSFHMVIARVVDGHLHVVDRMRERVQLAAGMSMEGSLAPEAENRALVCLERFGQRLKGMPKENVRAVGTNTFRNAKGRKTLLRRCEASLGHEIAVLPGREEARVLFRGVVHELPLIPGKRLVVDIGGGSTECIIGSGEEAQRMDSLQMGCVTFSERFFTDGKLTRDRFKRASLAARLELEPIERIFKRLGFDEVVGSSGTITTIEAMLRPLTPSYTGITLVALKQLRDTLIDRGHVDKLDLPGLSLERRRVIAGGVSILLAVFKAFSIDTGMRAAKTALREGLLLELVGSLGEEETRERTVARLRDRYAVEVEQAKRVEDTVLALARQLEGQWQLTPRELRMLSWSARLHEIGQALSFGGYHRHGAYIIANSDLPGFSEQGQSYLSGLVAAHRRVLDVDKLTALRMVDGERAIRLAVLLRLGVRINRARDTLATPEIHGIDNRVDLVFPSGFLETHPMTRGDFEEEQQLLRAASIDLSFR